MWETADIEHLKLSYRGRNTNFQMLECFINANGFNRFHWYGTTPDIKSVLKSGGFHKHVYLSRCYRNEQEPPYKDHVAYFKNTKTKVCCMTYQPYRDADEIRSEVEQWAKAIGLKAVVYDATYSWYYPNSTCFVIISLPEHDIKIK